MSIELLLTEHGAAACTLGSMVSQGSWLFEATVRPPVQDGSNDLEYADHFGLGAEVTILGAFTAAGFATTQDFRKKWIDINRGFVQQGRVWTAAQFRTDFCRAQHYEMPIFGFGIRRFVVVRDFPIPYESRPNGKPLLVDIWSRGSSYIQILKTRGRPVRAPQPC